MLGILHKKEKKSQGINMPCQELSDQDKVLDTLLSAQCIHFPNCYHTHLQGYHRSSNLKQCDSTPCPCWPQMIGPSWSNHNFFWEFWTWSETELWQPCFLHMDQNSSGYAPFLHQRKNNVAQTSPPTCTLYEKRDCCLFLFITIPLEYAWHVVIMLIIRTCIQCLL